MVRSRAVNDLCGEDEVMSEKVSVEVECHLFPERVCLYASIVPVNLALIFVL